MIPPRPSTFGIYLPCTFQKVCEDDTVEVLTNDRRYLNVTLSGVRLFDRFLGGRKEAAAFMEKTLQEAAGEHDLSVWIPTEKIPTSGSRVEGQIYIGSDSSLAAMIVHAKHGAYT